MSSFRGGLLAAVATVAMVLPLAGLADPVVINPFGSLSMTVDSLPEGATPGKATLVVHNQERGGDTIYFGFRLMGTEDVQMTSFSLPTSRCTVSDFAGRNTDGGYQGAPVFAAGADPAGTPNSHMRMIGGFLKPGSVSSGGCGNLTVKISFQTTPLVVFYGAFFGTQPAPWHGQQGTPWDTVPTGGDSSYNEWWNLWGTFDTLGYSNACTFVSGSANCG